jgi:hypothetical protein
MKRRKIMEEYVVILRPSGDVNHPSTLTYPVQDFILSLAGSVLTVYQRDGENCGEIVAEFNNASGYYRRIRPEE